MTLPRELLSLVFSNVDVTTYGQLCRVSKDVRQLCLHVERSVISRGLQEIVIKHGNTTEKFSIMSNGARHGSYVMMSGRYVMTTGRYTKGRMYGLWSIYTVVSGQRWLVQTNLYWTKTVTVKVYERDGSVSKKTVVLRKKTD